MSNRIIKTFAPLFGAVIFFIGSFVAAAQTPGIFEENRYRAAGCHAPYEAPAFHDTPAPEGYKPFYVSHFGRHGSRFQTGTSVYEAVLPFLDSMAVSKNLTPEGDSLRKELHLILEATTGYVGMLTSRGHEEHRQIAERLCRRVPDVFRQEDRPGIQAVSTMVPRTLESMTSFVNEIKGFAPSLDIRTRGVGYISVKVPGETQKRQSAIYRPLRDSLIHNTPAAGSFLARILKNPGSVEPSDRDPAYLAYQLFAASCGAGCLDIRVDPLRFFTASECAEFFQPWNLSFCARYGTMDSGVERTYTESAMLARHIIQEADKALEGNGRCADLRFGHDGQVGPFLRLLGVEGYDREVDPHDAASLWPSWKYIPMGSNVQMIFYRSGKDGDLVKVLRNENETLIPGLTPVSGPYYRWSDLRTHILKRLGMYVPLPGYYGKYLSDVAEKIRELRKDEADGFYFWTDCHYPENAGNSPAMLEYLLDQAGSAKVIFGGDATLNGNALTPGIDTFYASLLQMGKYGGLYPVRGNHDFTSDTHSDKPGEILGTFPVASCLSGFRGAGAVAPEGDPAANYYYVDNAQAHLRYIFVDSTEEVSDGRVVYGISDRQHRWIASTALGSLPDGWDAVVLSHVPLSLEKYPSLKSVGTETATSGRVLFFLSGHHHRDMESTIGDVFKVVTAADRLFGSGDKSRPYAAPLQPRKTGTVYEQTFDYVSISAKHDVVTMVRVGRGADRIFHLVPIELSKGERYKLPTRAGNKWFACDAEGNPDSTVVSVSSTGAVKARSDGNAIVVCRDKSGACTFYMIVVS